jgi:hypothetical protein
MQTASTKKIEKFRTLDKVKPDPRNIRGLNLAVVKLMIVQAIKLSEIRHFLLCKAWTEISHAHFVYMYIRIGPV